MSQKSEIRFEFVDLSVLNFFSLDSHFSRSKTANLFAVFFQKKQLNSTFVFCCSHKNELFLTKNEFEIEFFRHFSKKSLIFL